MRAAEPGLASDALRLAGPSRATMRDHRNNGAPLEAIAQLVAALGGRHGRRTRRVPGYAPQPFGEPMNISDMERLPGIQTVSLG